MYFITTYCRLFAYAGMLELVDNRDSKSRGETHGSSSLPPGTEMTSRRYKPRIVRHFIWSPDLAYAVGLITTDGCLSPDRRSVTFTSIDIEQVGNVKRILNAKGKLGFTRNVRGEAYRIVVSDVQFYDWLLSIGLRPAKSLILGSLNIPDEFFRDFVRGHLDGDGSITTYTDRYNTKKDPRYIYERIFVRFISGSEAHMIWLKDNITRLLKVKGRLHKTKPTYTGNSIYVLKFGKKESLKLLAKLYYSDTIPTLSRKRAIVEKFLSKQSER